MPTRLADGLEQWKCSSLYKNDSPQKFGSPAPFLVTRLWQQNCQRLEYTPALRILQATAERQTIEFFGVNTNTGYLPENFIISVVG
jgi:hypothetical protein